ncbi:ATP-binding protein [Planomonospora sp. ID82291]|uniref:ATP-binding protein n=1 Tax=Planomonospora sp. ID82291 TaxID=2738136 RepID=UPI0018C3BCF2|nr:ATP-binding protein [Planomonospora sp. ID82291]MBG0816625.1 CHASE domain-containing protein [Planomonospora sp. ID82291]
MRMTCDRRTPRGPGAGIVAALVAVVGLVASLGTGVVLHRAEDRAAAQAMDRRTESMRQAVLAESRRYTESMQAMAAALQAQHELTPDAFATVTAPLSRMGLPGASGIAFVVAASDTQIARVQADWRARGAAQVRLRPAGTGEHLFSVLQRPLSATGLPQPGLDVSASAPAAEAMRRARTEGTVVSSAPYRLLSDRQLPAERQQLSFALAAPVYAPAAGAARGPFRGWLLLGMRSQDFIGATMQTAAQDTLHSTLLAHVGGGWQPLAAGGPRTAGMDLQRRTDLTVAGRQWVLRTGAASEALPGGETHLDTGIAGAGALLTLLLATLVLVLASGRQRAEDRVRAATAELREAESEARRQAGLLGAVMDSISDGVGVVNDKGAFLLHNPAARAILGVDDDVDGADNWQSHYGLFRPDGATPLPTEELPLVRAIAGQSCDDVEMLVRNAAHPGGVLLNVSARPLQARAGWPGAVAVFRDITDRVTAQEQLQLLNERLNRLNGDLERHVAERTAQLQAQSEALRQANAELEAFSYSVSHDLRAPLRAVDGFAKVLAADYADALDEPGRRYLDKVRAGAQQMGQLIDGLLSFSRLQRQSMARGPVRLDTLVDEVWEELAPARADRDVRLRVGTLPTADGDRRLLRHVLGNLLGNAVKYTRGRERAEIEVGSHRDASGHVVYAVRDNGTGFDMRYADKLFQVFQRLHRAEDYEGTGIGLALAARVVHRHGGRIWAEAAPDAGAAFFFTVPAAGAPATVDQEIR